MLNLVTIELSYLKKDERGVWQRYAIWRDASAYECLDEAAFVMRMLKMRHEHVRVLVWVGSDESGWSSTPLPIPFSQELGWSR